MVYSCIIKKYHVSVFSLLFMIYFVLLICLHQHVQLYKVPKKKTSVLDTKNYDVSPSSSRTNKTKLVSTSSRSNNGLQALNKANKNNTQVHDIQGKQYNNQSTIVLNHFLSMDELPKIYRPGNWDGAPIVVEEFKLLFFTQAKVASTVFKQLMRRMMRLEDWQIHKEPNIPHNPAKNGLKYLYNFHPKEAYEIMTSEQWTRAIFVRDPKERLLSAYLDKAVRKNGIYVRRHCCPANRQDDKDSNTTSSCGKDASRSFEDFILVIKSMCCCDPHWIPQSDRIDEYFWEYINFIGHFDSIGQDTRQLLEKLNLWDEFGTTGWGKDKIDSIFAEGTSAKHQTSADMKLQFYYNQSDIEEMVENFYYKDYMHPLFNFRKRQFSASLFLNT